MFSTLTCCGPDGLTHAVCLISPLTVLLSLIYKLCPASLLFLQIAKFVHGIHNCQDSRDRLGSRDSTEAHPPQPL